MALDRRYVHVNIYNKGTIPFIMKQGPIFNMGMRYRFYEMLKMTPGIIIYTVDEDREMRAKGLVPGQSQKPKASQQQQAQPAKALPSQQVGIAEKPMTSIDEEIARRAGELPEYDDRDIVLSEGDIKEIKEQAASRVYTRYEMGGFSNAKLKYILNVERKQKPGSKYYGAFHDRKPTLIEYVLATQDPIPEEKEKGGKKGD